MHHPSFGQGVAEALRVKVERAPARTKPAGLIVVAGGVAANSWCVGSAAEVAENHGLPLASPLV